MHLHCLPGVRQPAGQREGVVAVAVKAGRAGCEQVKVKENQTICGSTGSGRCFEKTILWFILNFWLKQCKYRAIYPFFKK